MRFDHRPAAAVHRGVLALVLLTAILFGLSTTATAPAAAFTTPGNFSELSKKVSPAVVNIRTEKTLQGQGGGFRHFRGPFGDQDPFREFFEKFFGERGPGRDFTQRSLGSGFIIDGSGHIVTNNHVIEDADQIEVKLTDGREYSAEIVGRDPNTDLALIKIDADGALPLARLGDSDALEVGQWVVAIGSPFGLEHTVTAGIVSAKGRVIGSGPYDDFIQTDASINPGNSGGPLINMEGEVVGINTAIIASGQGIGFAVPVNMAKGIISQLKSHGEVTRGWLGVAIQDLTPEIAEYYGLEPGKGVLVTEVFEDDPADRAGIRAKDVITSVNGRPVDSSRELTRMIAAIEVGDQTRIDVIRDDRKRRFEVRIAKRDEEKILARTPRKEDGREELGIRVSNLTPEIVRRFNIDETDGVMITEVSKGSKAEEAGLMSGDIIKEINRRKVENVADFNEVVTAAAEGETLNLFIRRINVGFMVVKLTK